MILIQNVGKTARRTARPDSESTQDCEHWTRSGVSAFECASDGHYMCRGCVNFSAEERAKASGECLSCGLSYTCEECRKCMPLLT